MKTKMGMSIILALLMIVPAFAITTAADGNDCNHPGQVVLTKKVWDKVTNEWVDYEIEAECGETLKFKLEVTYHMDPDNSENLTLKKINITDHLDWEAYCFEYVEGSATITPTNINDNEIFWALDNVLEDNESLSIEFELLIKEIDCEQLTNINWATLTASECGIYDHYAEDYSYIKLKSGLYVEKKVWDPAEQQWADSLPYVTLSNNVKFQITATYYGCSTMKCMVIADVLPDECLDYLDTTKVEIAGVTIPKGDARYPEIYSDDDDTIIVCNQEIKLSDITQCLNDYIIFWDWRNADFNLHNGESVVVEFEADVTHYCDCQVTNWAVGIIWGCYLCDPCNYFIDCDSADVSCTHPPITFEKKVKDPETGQWVEEIHTFVDEKVRFQLEFTYYGEEVLNDIRIVDVLPCVLVYANNANIPETYVSEDKKTIWWNLTENVTDGDVITIEFDALVTDVTGSCGDCKAINHATLYIYKDCPETIVDQYTDTANVTSEKNCYPYVKYITGPTSGETGDLLKFAAKGKDQCGSDLEYWFEWGDGNSGWIGPYASDVEISNEKTSHSWSAKGIYTVKVKVRDEQGKESDWSEPALTVNITKGVPPEPDVKILFNKKWGLKKITVTIVNNLTTEIKDAFWEIKVQGGLLKKMNVTVNGTQNLTSGNNNVVFKAFKLLPIFGRLTIEVTVTVPGYAEPFKATTTAFKIGPIVRVKPLK